MGRKTTLWYRKTVQLTFSPPFSHNDHNNNIHRNKKQGASAVEVRDCLINNSAARQLFPAFFCSTTH